MKISATQALKAKLAQIDLDAQQVVAGVAFEATAVYLIACDMLQGQEPDLNRLEQACKRLSQARCYL